MVSQPEKHPRFIISVISLFVKLQTMAVVYSGRQKSVA